MSLLLKIKQKALSYKIPRNIRWKKILEENLEIKEFCERVYKNYQFANLKHFDDILKILVLCKKIKRCPGCGKILSYREQGKVNKVYCSKDCRKKCKFLSDAKREKTNLKRYGCVNVSNNKEIQRKKELTLLKNYGVDNPAKSKEIWGKIRNTNLERYGVELYAQTEESKRNYKLKRASFSDDKKNAMLEKQRKFYYKKYSEKYKKYFLEKCNLQLLDDYKGIRYSSKKFIPYRFKCLKCGYEFVKSLHSGHKFEYYCDNCYSKTSSAEKELVSFVKTLNLDIKLNDRKLLNPYEIDILIEDKKIGIEFNGLHWHSEEMGKDKNYHINKTITCEDNGYRLIQIFEDEWKFKQKIVKARLKHILGCIKNKIYARKCVVKEIDSKTASNFLNKYHIQGSVGSSVRLGLYYKNYLVSIMTFGKPRFNKDYKWELLRYASIFNFNIIGGAGKLLSYFKKNYKGNIISYADRRWSQGNLYKCLGFIEKGSSAPSYYYIKGIMRHNRVNFQKHKLKEKLGERYNPELSESENMKRAGFEKIWDCGNKIFVLNYD